MCSTQCASAQTIIPQRNNRINIVNARLKVNHLHEDGNAQKKTRNVLTKLFSFPFGVEGNGLKDATKQLVSLF